MCFIFELQKISQMPIYLGNSFNAWEFGEFSQFLRESEGSLFFDYWKFIKCLAFRYIFQIPRHLRDFKISSHLRYLQNLNTTVKVLQEFGKFWVFPKCLGTWEISQISWNMGNSPNSYFLQKYNCCWVMLYLKIVRLLTVEMKPLTKK